MAVEASHTTFRSLRMHWQKCLIPTHDANEGGKPMSALLASRMATEHGMEIVNGIGYLALVVKSGEYSFASAWSR